MNGKWKCTAIAATLAATSAQADVLTLMPTKDNTLVFSSSADDVNSNATGAIFSGQVGGLGNFTPRRGLLAFDLSTLPAGSTVTSVSLTLDVSNTRDTQSRTYTLHRVLADWGEGTSTGSGQGGPAPANDATWYHRFFGTTQLWTNPGGDFAATPSASTSVGLFGPSTFASTPELVADIQSWLNAPTTNFGWLLRGVESGSQTVRAFHSSESGGATLGPRLLVEFTPAPLPGDADGDGLVDSDDFALIDRGFASSLTGFANGDFNRDGAIDHLDYVIIDNAFANQSGQPMPGDLLARRLSTFGPGYADLLSPIAIPEPAALGLLSVLAAVARPRHRR